MIAAATRSLETAASGLMLKNSTSTGVIMSAAAHTGQPDDDADTEAGQDHRQIHDPAPISSVSVPIGSVRFGQQAPLDHQPPDRFDALGHAVPEGVEYQIGILWLLISR